MSVILTHPRCVCSAADLKLEFCWWSLGLMETSLAFICHNVRCLVSGSWVQGGSWKEDKLWRTLREGRCAGQRRRAFCVLWCLSCYQSSLSFRRCVMAMKLCTLLHPFQWWVVTISLFHDLFKTTNALSRNSRQISYNSLLCINKVPWPYFDQNQHLSSIVTVYPYHILQRVHWLFYLSRCPSSIATASRLYYLLPVYLP
jgi:hypothetical protein